MSHRPVFWATAIVLAWVFPATVSTQLDGFGLRATEIEESAPFSQPSRLHDHYDEGATYLAEDLGRFTFGPNGTRTSKRVAAAGVYKLLSDSVSSYAGVLMQRGNASADALTVRSDTYWKAIFSLPLDNTALTTRMMLLVRDGYLGLATMAALFCELDNRNGAGVVKLQMLDKIRNDLLGVIAECGAVVGKGDNAFNRGDCNEAIALYRKALEIHPKSPQALYGIAHCRAAKSGNPIRLPGHEPLEP